MHTETLNEATLFRASENLAATLFLDVTDLWRKANEKGSEDILLQRFEKGAKVPRVLAPERGPFEDTRYFDIYGPTVIATNEAIGAILDTRSVTVVMPDGTRDFPDPVTPERSLPLRERLVAFRARYLDGAIPEAEKPAQGRLGDVLQPLRQVIRLMAPHREAEFMLLVRELQGERFQEKSTTIEAEVLKAMLDLEGEVEEGKLTTARITEVVNEGRSEKQQRTPHNIGRKLRALGFQRAKVNGDRGVECDPLVLGRLAVKYGVADPPPEETSKTSETSSPDRFEQDTSDTSDVSPEADSRNNGAVRTPARQPLLPPCACGREVVELTRAGRSACKLHAPPDCHCYACASPRFWARKDGGWVCVNCHPPPTPEAVLEELELPMTATHPRHNRATRDGSPP